MQHLGESVRGTATEWLLDSGPALAILLVGGLGVVLYAHRQRGRRREIQRAHVARQIDERYGPLDALRVRAEKGGLDAVLDEVRALLGRTESLALEPDEGEGLHGAEPTLDDFAALRAALATLRERHQRLLEGKSAEPPPSGSNDLPGERL